MIAEIIDPDKRGVLRTAAEIVERLGEKCQVPVVIREVVVFVVDRPRTKDQRREADDPGNDTWREFEHGVHDYGLKNNTDLENTLGYDLTLQETNCSPLRSRMTDSAHFKYHLSNLAAQGSARGTYGIDRARVIISIDRQTELGALNDRVLGITHINDRPLNNQE